jgi:hypothetical protein
MDDTSFDRSAAEPRSIHRTATWFVRLFGLSLTLLAASAGAQLPGIPVLQNAWATPGVMIAVDGGGTSSRGTIAAAASWAPVARFQMSAGAGFQTGRAVGSSAAYGARVAVPLVPASSAVGISVFVGIGGASSHRNEATFPEADSVTNSTVVPAGASVGWRHLGGIGRGFSLYVAPAIVFYSGGTAPDNLFRLALGGDVGLSDVWGVTGGVDLGQSRPRGVGGPGGPQFGLGVSRAIATR